MHPTFLRAGWALFDQIPPKLEHPEARRSLRVLRMVHELHKRGYQRLRICPFMSPSGGSWRCWIVPSIWTSATTGAMPITTNDPEHLDSIEMIARYTSKSGHEYFGWHDAASDNASALAIKFLARFPTLCEAGRGFDWAYAGWLVTVLGPAEFGQLPCVMEDGFQVPGALYTISPTGGQGVRIPLPPRPMEHTEALSDLASNV